MIRHRLVVDRHAVIATGRHEVIGVETGGHGRVPRQQVAVLAQGVPREHDVPGHQEEVSAGRHPERSIPIQTRLPGCSVLGRRQHTVTEIDRKLERAAVVELVVELDQEVRASREDRQGIEVEADQVVSRELRHAAGVRRRLEVSLQPLHDTGESQDQERTRAAGRIEESLPRVPVIARAVQCELGQPVRGVELAQVMAELPGEQFVVQALQQVPGMGRTVPERTGVVVQKTAGHTPGNALDARAPGSQVPREQIAFEEVGDAEVTEDPAILELLQSLTERGRRRCVRDLLQRRRSNPLEEAGNMRGQELHEEGVVRVQSEEGVEGTLVGTQIVGR